MTKFLEIAFDLQCIIRKFIKSSEIKGVIVKLACVWITSYLSMAKLAIKSVLAPLTYTKYRPLVGIVKRLENKIDKIITSSLLLNHFDVLQ